MYKKLVLTKNGGGFADDVVLLLRALFSLFVVLGGCEIHMVRPHRTPIVEWAISL